MNVWGNKFKISIFGESHGYGIGAVIDGVPSGFEPDMEEIAEQMKRRAPGRNPYSTSRAEADETEIISGIYNGRTTGTPIAVVIKNTNTRSRDYRPELLRPSHADYTALCKYGESRDFRGGGHFSGRITAPLVFAGALARQILEKKGVVIGSHLSRVGSVTDEPFDMANVDLNLLSDLKKSDFPVIDAEAGEMMKREIQEYKGRGNSVGGTIETAICGVNAGVGSPFFGSVESRLSSMMFSIPAVKGIEFGMGFDFAKSNGIDANDEFYIENGEVRTYTNNNAGINGGITNGMPIVFRVAVKPTPSVAASQRTVNIESGENSEIRIEGRHDPCIVQRAAVVVESAAAITMLDMILSEE